MTSGDVAGQVVGGPATVAVLRRAADLARTAQDAGRDDLADRLRLLRRRLAAVDVPVAVLGEFKQGKSTLCNALLRTDVCPADPDVGTAVPTVLRWGRPARALAHRSPSATGTPDETPLAPPSTVPLDRLHEAATDRRADGSSALTSVEVLLDRTLLRTGLVLVDTPGLGGLASADGVTALATLARARAAVFATAAGRELTAAEVEYLREVVRRCPTTVVVVTMTDLHASWRQVVDLDRAHLAAAGLDLPVVPASSFLRMQAAATGDQHLHERSGFTELLRLLGQVLKAADRERADAAATELRFVVEQLREPVLAQRAVLADPAAAAGVVARLEDGARRSERLASPTAGWQVALADGTQDLVADVDHDLRQRMLDLVRRAETRVDEQDPRVTWDDLTAWVRAEAARAAVANLQLLVERADELVREVAEQFDDDVAAVDVDLPTPALTVGAVPDARIQFTATGSRTVLGLMTTARVGYGGGLIGGIGGAVLLGTAVLAPVGALVGVALARRIIREDRKRELQMHRDNAKRELRRFVDEMTFALAKDSRDAARRTQRRIRDELTARASLVHRSAAQALRTARDTARLAADLDPAGRDRLAREADRRWQDLGEVTGATP
ncbi:dynamin family protein [Thalassiella azotivora]